MSTCAGDFLVKNTRATDQNVAIVSNPYNLSQEDFNEIADYMMQLWMKLKENIRLHGLQSDEIFEEEK